VRAFSPLPSPGLADAARSAHGTLKSVRLPRRLDRRARGFAFVEFAAPAEAAAARAALQHTHLLGRHLVLEWADEGAQDVEALRAKAGVGYGEGKAVPGRRTKIVIGEEDDGGEDVE
jgi:multiple RNA-binding domain-containing protein 1